MPPIAVGDLRPTLILRPHLARPLGVLFLLSLGDHMPLTHQLRLVTTHAGPYSQASELSPLLGQHVCALGRRPSLPSRMPVPASGTGSSDFVLTWKINLLMAHPERYSQNLTPSRRFPRIISNYLPAGVDFAGTALGRYIMRRIYVRNSHKEAPPVASNN